MIKWNELPQEIQERMLEEQEKQTGKRDASVFEENTEDGFVWDSSKEGFDFWEEILIHKNIEHFYTLYPKLKTNPNAFNQGESITQIDDHLNTLDENYLKSINKNVEKEMEKIIIKTDGKAMAIAKKDHFVTSSGLKVYAQEKLMWVSNDKNFSDKVKRVVFAEKGGIYLSWGVCDDLEYSKNYITTMNWNFAKEIEPPQTFTLDQAKQALAKEHGLSVDEVEIVK